MDYTEQIVGTTGPGADPVILYFRFYNVELNVSRNIFIMRIIRSYWFPRCTIVKIGGADLTVSSKRG